MRAMLVDTEVDGNLCRIFAKDMSLVDDKMFDFLCIGAA